MRPGVHCLAAMIKFSQGYSKKVRAVLNLDFDLKLEGQNSEF
jgi:hypothetical protein